MSSATTLSPTAPLSPYDRRLKLVVTTIRENQKIDEAAAGVLAAHVLHALDHVPERVR